MAGRVRFAVAALALAALSLAGCATAPMRPQAVAAAHAVAPAVRSSSARSTAPVATTAAPATTAPPATTQAATPAPAPQCAANTQAQFVLVDIASQQAFMCAGTALAHQTYVTTGATAVGADTPTGTFHLLNKQTDQYLNPLTGGSYYVHYWLPFEGNLYGFHDASWQTFPYGSPQYRTDGSHGCVHLPLADMTWLFTWAQVGATITIR